MDAIAREDINVDNLAKIIGQDASLSASILAAANSSFYRQWGEVTDLKRMIVVLGLTSVKTLVMTKAIGQFFARIPPAQQSYLEIIWYRSLTCAHLARNLAQLTAYDFPDEVYLVGLIHRLGQLVLMQCYPKEYPGFLAEHMDGEQELTERTLFGAAHNEIGAYIIADWNLPSFIADAVRCQYQAVETISDSAAVVKILNLASQLSSMDDDNKYFIFGQANKLFGLNQSLVESMLEDVKPLVDKSAGSLGITIAKSGNNKISNLTTTAHRDSVHAQLGDHVKNLALTATVQEALENSGEFKQLVSTIRRDMSILFGFQVVAFFLYRPETHSLDGISGEQDVESLWSSISINLKSNTSLLSKAWHKKRILHSFNLDKTDPSTFVDRQICQLMAMEDMLLIPLIQNEQVLGVIAAGLKRADVKRIKLNLSFITLFINEAAKILQHLSTVTPENATEMRANYALYARKLGHEINNPLSIINNYLYLLGLKLGEDHADELRVIQEEIDRVGTIALSLSDFSLDSPNTVNDVVDLNVLIMDLVKLCEAGIFKTHAITTRLNLDRSSPKIATNKDKLKQIMTNLLKNAVEAMPAGGEIFIATKASVTPGKKHSVEIQIGDNGPGLPEDIMKHLFKPVKSTKGKHASGLGLTISKSLVDELKGIIQCDSSPGQGTTFHIVLP
jgi:signal transduction histidine kinase/HD-like signal output (HDOD) protein